MHEKAKRLRGESIFFLTQPFYRFVHYSFGAPKIFLLLGKHFLREVFRKDNSWM